MRQDHQGPIAWATHTCLGRKLVANPMPLSNPCDEASVLTGRDPSDILSDRLGQGIAQGLSTALGPLPTLPA